MDLHDKTLTLLQNRPVTLTLKKIAQDTGLTMNWLVQFHNGKAGRAPVKFVQPLYEYLTNDLERLNFD